MIAKCFDVQEMVETINIYDKNWKRILPKFHKRSDNNEFYLFRFLKDTKLMLWIFQH